MTLALVVALTSLLYLGFEMSEAASRRVEEKHLLLQRDLLLANVIQILQRKRKELNSSQGLEMLVELPLELEAEGIAVELTFDSAAKGINPNNFVMKDDRNRTIINPDFVLLFDRILQTYDVENKELFIAMIEDTLDPDLNERIPGSELALSNRRFAQGAIEGRAKFHMLIQRYIELTQDPKILAVPWDKILSFHAPKIDLNHIEPTLLRLILPYLGEETIQQITTGKAKLYGSLKELPLAKEDRAELKKYGVVPFVPILQGDLVVREGKRRGEVKFIYDLAEQRVLEIEEKIF